MNNTEDMNDTRLPMVAWWLKNSGGEKDLVGLGSGEHVYQGVYDEKIFLCRITDAQARLAEKDARIAQLAAHARGKNKALANALKEIERLKRTIETGLDNELALVGERTELRAQLEQLQAAPAERGAPDETAMARALCNYHADLCGVNRDDQWNLYSEDFLNDVAVMLAADRRLNPAPATADSDVREVK